MFRLRLKVHTYLSIPLNSVMKCPHCQVFFHPKMQVRYLAQNGRGIKVHLYHQTCPECKEVRETENYGELSETLEGLRFLVASPP
jgi:hypothetical protein